MGNNLYDRQVTAKLPQLQNSEYFRHDPIFGEYIDSLIGNPQILPLILERSLRGKKVIKIADFGCAPKKEGSSNLVFLKSILTTLFPDKRFEFFGYDIDFRGRYPNFDSDGNFVGWEEAYLFDGEGTASYKEDTYYNANDPSFNIIPRQEDSKLLNTFDTSHNQYDIVINSMFYSVYEMNGEPEESLDIMRGNLLDIRNPEGVLFLNTCDDCFKIFPSPERESLPEVIPFISSLDNIGNKIDEILTGGAYCKGLYNQSYKPSKEEKGKGQKGYLSGAQIGNKGLDIPGQAFRGL